MSPRVHADDPRALVVRNTLVLLLLRVGTPLLSVAVVLAVSRYLGAEGLGRYTIAFTFLYFFVTLAPLGLHPIVTRDGARDRAALDGLLGNAILLGGTAALVLTPLMAGLGPLLGYDGPTCTALALLSLAILPATVITFCDAAFTALERMGSIALAALAECALKVGAAVALLWAGFGLPAVLMAAVAGRVLGCLVSLLLVRRAGLSLRWAAQPAVLRELAARAPTFLLIAVFATLYWRIDVVMLSQLRPVEDVGRYGAAHRLLELAMVVPQSVCLAVYPRMAHAAHTDVGALAALGRATLRWLVALTVPAAVVVTVLADRLLAFLYGAAFADAAGTLAVLVWTVVPYAWVRYHAYLLVAAERQGVDLALNVAMAAGNVALNLALIPVYGPFGAAVATLIAICVYGGGQYLYLRRALPGHLAPLPVAPATVGAAAAAGAAAWLLADANVVLALAGAAALAVAALRLAGFFTTADLRLLGLDRALRSVGLPVRAAS